MDRDTFEKDTSHVVVQFNEKSKDGKKTIDLVPVSWVYPNDKQLYCKYPTKKKEYTNLNEMCKTSAAHGPFWKSFEITIIKEAAQTSSNIKNMKPCRTCGCTCSTVMSSSEVVTKAQLESTRRSIEYRITEEAKITRHLFAAHNNVGDIDNIMQDEQINDMPKLNLEDFQDFDAQLKTDLELVKKLKCFMLINIKSGMKLTENLTAVMPCIMSKDVQLLYSGFGRETNGCKKLNFSATQIYKYLLDVITTKDPSLKINDISSQLSRWFSGAKDREGGKKERQYHKMKKSSESTDNKNE